MSISTAKKETLIQVEIDSLRKNMVWSDVTTIMAGLNDLDKQAFIDVFYESNNALIRRKLDEYFRPTAITNIDAIIAQSVDFENLLIKLI